MKGAGVISLPTGKGGVAFPFGLAVPSRPYDDFCRGDPG